MGKGISMANVKDLEPVKLIEDGDTGDRFIIYAGKDDMRVELSVLGDTFWATQQQMAAMFGVTRSVITRHIKNIFDEGELAPESTCSFFEHVGSTGQVYRTQTYNLNVLISVGYRVGSKQGTMFRIWATDTLFQYLMKGFVVDVRRLESPAGRPDFFGELLEKIRHIRASEQRMWTRVLELASFCNDYDARDSKQQAAFFAEIQNAMHWAITQRTAAEVIHDRVNHKLPNAGLTRIKGDLPTVEEAKIAKNYYGDGEIAALNLITNLILEFFESQAEQRRPTTLAQFLEKMRELIKLDGRPLMPAGHRGHVGKSIADKKASEEVALYKDRVRIEREAAGERDLLFMAEQVKAAVKRPRRKKSA